MHAGLRGRATAQGAHPLFQRPRLLEEVNTLKIVRAGENPKPLTREQRDLLLLKLGDKRRVSSAT